MVAGGGGGGRTGFRVRVSRFPYYVLRPPVLLCPFASRLPPFIVLLLSSGLSRLIKALALSRIKNCVEKWTTLHSLARSLKWHSFEPSLYLEAKSAVIWDEQSCRPSSQEGLPWTDFSLPQRKIPRPTNLVFDDIWPEWPWIASFASLPDTEV